MSKHICQLICMLLLSSILMACATNPVTGKRELTLVSESQEVNIGEENYGPTQQSQGGEYTVDESLSAYVSEVGQRLAKVSDRPELPYEFTVLNNDAPNAWALPGGKIAINRGLLVELKNEAELAAVLGHEIVHAAARHGAKSMERGMLLNVGIVGLSAAVGGEDNANLILGAAGLGANLISQKYGRSAELESDHYGMDYMARAGYNPQGAVTLQETFVRLSQGQNSSWLEGLFASHPPSQERVNANRKYARKLGLQGTLGAAEYQAKIAHLKKTAPAYDALAKGQQALKDKKPDEALRLANQAIEIEPRESQFYSLQGDAWLAKKNPQLAEASYSQAVKYNGDYFLPYLQRGVARQAQDKNAGAKQDLETSAKMLPTATAYLNLGDLAVKTGNSSGAIDYYRQASNSDSATGKQAQNKLMNLDLSRNPQNYLQLHTALGPQGTVIARIANPTSVDVKNIQVRLGFVDLNGQLLSAKDVSFKGTIPAGKFNDIDSELAPPTAGNATLQAVITHAEPGSR